MNKKSFMPEGLNWYQILKQKIWPWSHYRNDIRLHKKILKSYEKMYEMMKKNPLKIPIYPCTPIIKVNKNGDCFIDIIFTLKNKEESKALNFTIAKKRGT